MQGGIPWQDFFCRVLCAKSACNAQIVPVFATLIIFLFGIPSVLIGYVALNTDWDVAGFNSTIMASNSELVSVASSAELFDSSICSVL